MRKAFSYILYFSGFAFALLNLFDVIVETDKGGSIYRSPEYAVIVIIMSVFIYLVCRDAAIIVRGKKFTDE